MFNVRNTNNLVDTTSNGKELGFSSCNVDHIMNYFDNWFIMWVNVQNWGSNIISYTGIGYNDERVGSEDILIVILSRLHKWFLTSWVWEWKEKWSEKESISLFPRENSS